MLHKLRVAGVVWVTLFSVPALLILIGLGTWQLQRKAWKDDLQAKIDLRAAEKPLQVENVLDGARSIDDIAYTHVVARGRFRHESELYYYAPRPQEPGWHVYTPMQLDDGRWLFVNRGFVPATLRDPSTRADGQVAGVTSVTGLLRVPEAQGTFSPENDVVKNVWYWRDLDGMKRAVFGTSDVSVAPGYLDAEIGHSVAGPWPRSGTTITRLANRHLEYALTWYGLALTLIGVYAAFVYGRLKSSPVSL